MPSVAVVGTTFVRTASLIASWAGVADLGVAEYPGAIQLHTEAGEAQLQADAEVREKLETVVLDRIIEGLTRQVETATVGSDLGNGQPMKFSTFEEVNEFFSEKGWTDRLPIIPPTTEKVEEFLRWTDRSPDEEIATLPQANLRATPRNIAANAVMAGCRPEFMPLLIAAVEALGEPDFQLMSIGSTGCKTPWLLVNGPIVKQLGIEYGVAARSRGPNPAIGRALGLIVNNIAGFRPGETYMGTWGYYLPFVLAEDEDACDEIGWKPYHVEHGFSRATNTVTARTTTYWGDQARPAGASGKSILQVMCNHQERMIPTEVSLPFGEGVMVAVLVTPYTAKVLASNGYSKRDVADYLWQNTRIAIGKANTLMQGFAGFDKEVSSGFRTVHDIVAEGVLPKWFDVGTEETIPVLPSTEVIDVIVSGDGHIHKAMSLWCNYNKPVTKEIRLPVGWDKLAKEK